MIHEQKWTDFLWSKVLEKILMETCSIYNSKNVKWSEINLYREIIEYVKDWVYSEECSLNKAGKVNPSINIIITG